MIVLLRPNTDSLTAVLAGAVNSVNPTYKAQVSNGGGPVDEPTGQLSGATAVEIVPAPTRGQIEVKEVHFYNADDAAVVLTLNKKISGTSYPLLKVTLQVGDTLRYDQNGIRVVDSSGMARIIRTGYKIQVGTRAKVGGTAGWVVAAADNLSYVGTLPASQTGSKLVLPIDGLHIGDTITAFKINAQIESAGGAVTLDADLRAITNVAADPTDASIGTITQVAVTADTAVAAEKTGLTEVVTAGKSYYLVITATTAASTDIILLHPEVTLTLAG